MNILHTGRRMGKSTQMMEWMKGRTERILLVSDQKRVTQLEREYPEFKGTKRILTFRDYLHIGRTFPKKTKVSIDETSAVLQSIITHDLVNLTIT